jgi:prephenate dehydrogenase
MKIAIIGLGLIGGSMALDLKERNFSTMIIGVEQREEYKMQAMELELVDKIMSLNSAISIADIIILAIPVNNILKELPYILTNMKDKAIVIDTGSTKEVICSSVDKHPNRRRYVPTHPMAGTENSGPHAAIKNMFDNKTCIICDEEKSDKDAIDEIVRMYEYLNMRIVYMNSFEHDLHAAFVSHLSHITSFALANAVLEKERDRTTLFDLAGGGFESTARLAKSNPEMWAPIFQQNKKNICEALNLYIKHIKMFKESIEEDNLWASKSLMYNANSIRRVLNKIHKNQILIN